MENPYAPTSISDTVLVAPSTRSRRTYFDAAMLGAGTSLVAPWYFAVVRRLFAETSMMESLPDLLIEIIPPAFVCTVIALLVSSFVPQRVCQLLSRGQNAIPLIIITTLFSLYFTAIGYGYIGGYVALPMLRIYLANSILIPGAIAGTATLLHVCVRPSRSR